MAKAVKTVAAGKRVAVVTGAASGIGRATLDMLLAKGWRVAALDRDEAALSEVRTTFGKSADVMAMAVDVCDEPGVERTIKDVVAHFGRLDGVVNSAGIAADIPAMDTPVELFKRILDVNVIGSFIVARAADAP